VTLPIEPAKTLGARTKAWLRKHKKKAVAVTIVVAATGTIGIIRAPHICACATPVYGDVTPPTVALTAPANNATVSGAAVTVSATATDNVSVASVTFKLDGVTTIGTDSSNPYSVSWDSTATTDGTHTITAQSVDTAGNLSSIDTRTVTVSNGGGGGGSPTGNEWVSAAGAGSCGHSGSLISYSAALTAGDVCTTIAGALTAASSSGDLVRVHCGTYDSQTVTASKAGTTTIQAETPLCATIQSTTTSASLKVPGADFLTFKDFHINAGTGGACCAIADDGSTTNPATNLTFQGNDINVNAISNGTAIVLFHAAQHITLTGNIWGPTCCGLFLNSSPEGLRIGKPGSGDGNSCVNEACFITVSNNTFQYILNNDAYWPSSGWGSSPSTRCTNASTCHMDSIHMWGVQNVDITNNQFLGDQCQDVFIETSGVAPVNKNINIIGNTGTQIANQCNGFISLNGLGSGNAVWAGTVNVGFNEGAVLNMTLQDGGFQAGTVLNIYGNYQSKFFQSKAAGGGLTATNCFASPPTNLTIHFQYNVWTSGVTCDATDTTGNTPAWVNNSAAPAVGLDMHKTGGAGTADNFVPCASLTIGNGCPSTDYDGNAYAATADAGADQR
jgi:hypothetical protein